MCNRVNQVNILAQTNSRITHFTIAMNNAIFNIKNIAIIKSSKLILISVNLNVNYIIKINYII